MALNLHLLRLFVGVVEHGGVGAAARAMNISQPAVSRAIRELETQLGVELLDRSGRRGQLTPGGAEIYAQARAVYAAEHAVEDVVDGLKGLTHGTLRIAASTTIATYVIPKFIAEFALFHPAIELQLSAVHTRVIVDMVHHYAVDVALAEAPVTDADITVTPWQRDEMVVIASPNHRLAGEKSIAPTVISAERFLLREPESGTRLIVLASLTRAGVEVRRSMSVDGTEVIKRLVAEGLGIAVVSRVAVASELATGQLVTLDVRKLRVERWFNSLSLDGRRPILAARAFHARINLQADAAS
jgi:DNA-binding transcriptional LysR family regulator